MQDFSIRLNQAMSAKNLSLRDLSEKTGINYEMIRRYSKGQAKPRNDKMKLLAQCLGVPITWLDYGEGEMTKNNDKLTPITEWDDSTPLDDDEAEIPFYKDIAFACGYGAVNDDVTHETRKLRMGKRTLSNLGVMPENAFAVTARDDSMMPYVQDGDTIYIDKGRKEVKDGRIFAIRFGELCLCKRLYRLPDGGVRIVSDNAAEFPEQVATKQQISDGEFEVIGWVWSVSRLERW
ncbi:LexA family transcriptional regulator [Moraxella catarrhalis]|uniref:LexA family transcriptional regulator n=1 Tax=Moraxella catarrhalis TaxID=480 RepID=UPI003872DC11